MTQQTLPRALSVELHVRQPGLDVRAQFRALPGRVCAIVGRQGAGKTALLKAAAGLAPALSGRVALGTDVLYDTSARVDLPPHLRRLSWLDAHAHVFPHLNVRDNLLYGRRVLGRLWSRTSGAELGSVARWAGLQSMLQLHAHALGPSQRLRVGDELRAAVSRFEKRLTDVAVDLSDASLIDATLRLQQDHGWLEENWIELRPLIEQATLGNSYVWEELDHALQVFHALYQDHMVLEERIAYPGAKTQAVKWDAEGMGREMASRRKLRPQSH